MRGDLSGLIRTGLCPAGIPRGSASAGMHMLLPYCALAALGCRRWEQRRPLHTQGHGAEHQPALVGACSAAGARCATWKEAEAGSAVSPGQGVPERGQAGSGGGAKAASCPVRPGLGRGRSKQGGGVAREDRRPGWGAGLGPCSWHSGRLPGGAHLGPQSRARGRLISAASLLSCAPEPPGGKPRCLASWGPGSELGRAHRQVPPGVAGLGLDENTTGAPGGRGHPALNPSHRAPQAFYTRFR